VEGDEPQSAPDRVVVALDARAMVGDEPDLELWDELEELAVEE
jgi:hypothetical protein